MPDWQLEPEELYLGDEYLDPNAMPMVDEHGNPIMPPGYQPGMEGQLPPPQPGSGLTQEWLDNAIGGGRQPQRPPPQAPPPSSQPPPGTQQRSPPQPDPSQPRPGTP